MDVLTQFLQGGNFKILGQDGSYSFSHFIPLLFSKKGLILDQDGLYWQCTPIMFLSCVTIIFEFICLVLNLFLNKSSQKNSFPQIHSSCQIILKSTFSIEFDADETVFWNFFEFLFLFWIFFSINRLKLFWNPHFLLDLRLMKLFSGIPPKWQNFPYHSLWPSQMEPPFKLLKN